MLRTLGLKPLRFGSKPVAETLEISLSCVTSEIKMKFRKDFTRFHNGRVSLAPA